MSQVPLHDRTAIVFDLDDTLYQERDFVRSGFAAVSLFLEGLGCEPVFEELDELFSCNDPDPFGSVLQRQARHVDKSELLKIYRNHLPHLKLQSSAKDFLEEWTHQGKKIGILTDGRSKTQRNKIQALGLNDYADEIVISGEFGSEKPDEKNYRYFEERFTDSTYVYVGDNLSKDFVTPNRLGWTTVGLLDRGNNIHAQRFEKVSDEMLPQYVVEELA